MGTITKINTFEEGIDETKYAYALCECTLIGEAIRIERPDTARFIHLNCPECRKELGIFVKDMKGD